MYFRNHLRPILRTYSFKSRSHTWQFKKQSNPKTSPPKNNKQLKSFLGLANYFRQYINGFSKIAEPLFKLTQKDSHWPAMDKTFPDDAVKAFNDLKAAIVSKPVLAYPNRGGKFTLMVD